MTEVADNIEGPKSVAFPNSHSHMQPWRPQGCGNGQSQEREDASEASHGTRLEKPGFDTWINNAGVAIYGTCEEVPLEDQRRLFDTNYWGVVYGSLIAAKHLRQRGGKIINTGSVLSDRAVILQGPYSASKHAVKAFTDVLRMELEESGAPVSVTLIKPSAIDTPYMEHARNYLETGTKNPPPSYDPRLVAKAIVYACEHHKRDLVVGFGGWAVAALGQVAPRLTDFIMEGAGRALQKSSDPGRPQRRDNLYAAREDGAERSSLPGGRLTRSLFLEAQIHPVATTLTLLAVGAAASAWLGSGTRQTRRASRRRYAALERTEQLSRAVY